MSFYNLSYRDNVDKRNEDLKPSKSESARSGGGWGFRGFFAKMQSAREAKQTGKIWDPESKEYVLYLLDDELKEIEEKEKEESGNVPITAGSDEREVKDREYYDLLCVSTNATQGEIKKVRSSGDESAYTCTPGLI